MGEISELVDTINRRTIRAAVHDYSALVAEGLNAPEHNALESVINEIRGKRILDLGVGAGRTAGPLSAISAHYIGVDYVQEMVDHCRTAYPDLRFVTGDARSMPMFADASFDLVFFSCNGISMVDHEGRLAILSEVRRLLAPRGIFIFSTCNGYNRAREMRFKLPPFERSTNPLKLLVRAGRFATQSAFRVFNRWRYKRHEVQHADYAILTSAGHHYRTLLYFIGPREQARQLERAGFAVGTVVYDLAGRPADARCEDGTLTFVARKAASEQERRVPAAAGGNLSVA